MNDHRPDSRRHAGAPPDDRTTAPTGLRWPASSAASRAGRVVALWEGGSACRAIEGPAVLVIGRSKQCDVRVDHPSISRRHARLHIGAELRIEDLGSSHGIRVRGSPIAPGSPTAFAPGALVEIGGAVIVVQRPEAGEGVAPSRDRGPHAPFGLAQSASTVALDRLLGLVAASDLGVILAGETGVGKDVAAASIHRRSRRSAAPFVRVNCAALADTLLETELFGHARGAFTGAAHAKVGLLEAANGGTLLLDEVGELSPSTQAKLLRAIENREITRVGEVHPRAIDVRFLAATNRDLAALLVAERFRHDFYFRLNGITITIPPLRARAAEIPELASRFAAEAVHRVGGAVPSFSPAVVAALAAHPWPGNLRELRNVVERACLLSGGAVVTPDHIVFDIAALPGGSPASGDVTPPSDPPSLRRDVEELERRRILEALEACAGNQSRAAQMLGISRPTLGARLDAFGIARPRKGKRGSP